MTTIRRALPLLLLLLLLAPPAEAKISARASLAGTADGARIVVTVSGIRATAVTVKAGGKKYKLRRRGRRWRSAPLRTATADALAGKRLSIRIRSRSRSKTVSALLPATGGGGGGGGGEQVDPKALAAQLITDQQFGRPFATQYTSGEELWRFCSGGTFFYRYTSSGQYSTSENYGNGTWEIREAKTGTVEGMLVVEAAVLLNGNFSDGGAKQGNLIVDVSSQTTRAYLNDGTGTKEFMRGPLQGGC